MLESHIFDLRLGIAGTEGLLCTLFCDILYKGLEHPWILISAGDPVAIKAGEEGVGGVKERRLGKRCCLTSLLMEVHIFVEFFWRAVGMWQRPGNHAPHWAHRFLRRD